jgi:hypothetical protein
MWDNMFRIRKSLPFASPLLLSFLCRGCDITNGFMTLSTFHVPVSVNKMSSYHSLVYADLMEDGIFPFRR